MGALAFGGHRDDLRERRELGVAADERRLRRRVRRRPGGVERFDRAERLDRFLAPAQP